jgi:hypothetical protein
MSGKAPIVEWPLEINSFEVDQNSNIKTVSLQNLLQEVAYKGSDFCGCGPEFITPEFAPILLKQRL